MNTLAPSGLTHRGLVLPYGDINLGQHWLREWLVAWCHQAITWTNVDLSSVRSSGIHLRAILQEIPQPSVNEISLKITYLKFCSNLPGADELNSISISHKICTLFSCVLFCYSYIISSLWMYIKISLRITSLALGQSYDCPSASEEILIAMGEMDWITQNTVCNTVPLTTLRPWQNGCLFKDNIFTCIFLNENVLRFKFYWSLFLTLKLTIFQQWFK